MADMRKTPALAQTIRGYIKHAPDNWRAHMAAAADQIEHAATMRRTIEEMVRLSAGARQDMERLAKDAAELRDELGAMLPEIAALDRQRSEIEKLRALLRRYRNETPLGHQPHMIAHEVDAALAKGGPQ